MLYKILRLIYRVFKPLFLLHSHLKKKVFHFLLPNLLYFSHHSRTYESCPSCFQRTFLTGKGIVKIGKGCSFGSPTGGFYRGGSVEFQARYASAKIIIGNRVCTNNNLFVCAANHIEIGNDTLIGQYVSIMDHEAHGIEPDKRKQIGTIAEVWIGENVWIGNNVTILKNTKIGNNSVVAAGAVVSGCFPENVIIGGVPAKIIRNI